MANWFYLMAECDFNGNGTPARYFSLSDTEGIVVEKLEEVGPALERAVAAQMNEGKTTVVEIMCTRELGDPFRRDALSKPVRLLEKYKDYV